MFRQWDILRKNTANIWIHQSWRWIFWVRKGHLRFGRALVVIYCEDIPKKETNRVSAVFSFQYVWPQMEVLQRTKGKFQAGRLLAVPVRISSAPNTSFNQNIVIHSYANRVCSNSVNNNFIIWCIGLGRRKDRSNAIYLMVRLLASSFKYKV